MSDVAQSDLALSREPNAVDVPIEMIRAKKTAGAAFTLACDSSGLDDKEIYLPLGMDKAVFSRIKSGSVTLDADKLAEFCRVVGNIVYVRWMAYQAGYACVLIKSEAERRAEAAERERDAALAENKLMRELLKGKQ